MLTVTTATSVEFPFSDMLAERAGVMLPDADDMVLDARIVAPSMGQYIPKFNVRPTFFDISDVANPADRIAHHLQYMFAEGDELSKSASAEFPFSDMLGGRPRGESSFGAGFGEVFLVSTPLDRYGCVRRDKANSY